jgi:hypothetical protein
MEAEEFAEKLKKLGNQAHANSVFDPDPATGSRWKIVADLVDRVVSSKVMENLQSTPKKNQPPQY